MNERIKEKLYKQNGTLKIANKIEKVKSIDFICYLYLKILEFELKTHYNKNYPVNKLIDYHFNKQIKVENIKEWIDENLLDVKGGLDAKKIQKNALWIKINFPNHFDYLIENFNRENWMHILYDAYHNINTYPNCEYCGNKTKFHSFNKGYNRFCSQKCSANSKETIKKREDTLMELYGVKVFSQSEEIKENIRKNCQEKYGVDWTSQIPEAIKKKENTCLLKYGTKTPSQNEDVKKKMRETTFIRYGVENILQIPEIHNLGIEASRTEESKKKIRETTLKNHGVEYVLQKKEFRDLAKEGTFKKYGVDYCLQSPIIQKKIKEARNNKKEKKYEKLKKYLENEYNLIIQEEFPNSFRENVKCTCSEGHSFYRLGYVLKRNPYCPYCNKKNGAKAEQEISIFISNYINKNEILKNYRDYNNGKNNNQSYCELDIFITEKKLAIEYNGLYWHSENNGKNKNYHLNKTELCKAKDIQLIHIFEDEYNNHKEIVQSMLLSKLGKFENKIYARKCVVKEISPKEKNIFLEENHIQGKDTSTYKLGLFYKDELVSVMTFGKRKITGKSTFELIRFCSKLNTQIVGGASKLFKYFLNNLWNEEEIVSYADRRWSNGNLYKQLGFEFSHFSSPNYWYVDHHKRYHRVSFQKHKLEKKLDIYDSNLTEWENMQMNGYDRIWDCGNYVFKYIK